MATKTISLAEDAYARLAALKRPGESFSDVVRRLTRRRSLTELANVMSRESADELAAAIADSRRDRMHRRRRELGV